MVASTKPLKFKLSGVVFGTGQLSELQDFPAFGVVVFLVASKEFGHLSYQEPMLFAFMGNLAGSSACETLRLELPGTPYGCFFFGQTPVFGRICPFGHDFSVICVNHPYETHICSTCC